MIKVLQTLAEFLQAGIGLPETRGDSIADDNVDDYPNGNSACWAFPLCQTAQNMIPDTSVPYAYLNLFGQPRDEEGEMYETREDRFRVFSSRFMKPVERGLESVRKEGGELGRASTAVNKVLREAISSRAGA